MTRLEGCHSDILGDGPRGRTTTSLLQDGWRVIYVGEGQWTREPVMRSYHTAWIEKACGIAPQKGFDDPGCANCSRYPKEKEE